MPLTHRPIPVIATHDLRQHPTLIIRRGTPGEITSAAGTCPTYYTVACQRDGTTVLPRAWDHLGVWLIMAVIGRSGQRRPAVRVGFVGGRTVLL